MDDLVDAADIAERLGLTTYRTVHSWRRRPVNFPAPVVDKGACILWLWADVERWARETERLA